MDKIPITLIAEGKIYDAVLSEGAGAGYHKTWHLMINNYYYGQLIINARGEFVFHGNSAGEKFEMLVHEMEYTLISWYQ